MFKTPYRSLFRVHTIKEAIELDMPKDKTDLFLYLIDTYDVLLSISTASLPSPSRAELTNLRMKFHNCILDNFHKMYTPIPGAVLGWTESMLMYVVMLSVIEIQHMNSPMEMPTKLRDYVKNNKLRMYEDHDMTTWNLDTVCSQLDCISLRWEFLEPCQELDELLEIMWRFAARFILRLHTKDVINVENYQEDVAKQVRVRLTPDGIMVFMSRWFWFNHMIKLRSKWKTIREPVYDCPSLETSNWKQWITHEKRHFVTRRFRDGISDWMWDKLILFGDQEIASHDQLGDEVSAFTCMYARFPAGLVSLWQRILTYKDYEEIIECKAIKDYVHVHMINAHFTSVYNVSFLKYFFIYDKKLHQHINAISKASTPIVLYWYNKFFCYFHGKVYEHPGGTSVGHAFLLWCYILRKECEGRCYDSMDFSQLCEQLMDKKEVVNNDRNVDGFFTLEDD